MLMDLTTLFLTVNLLALFLLVVNMADNARFTATIGVLVAVNFCFTALGAQL
jgi:hypothetical protein